MQKKNLVFALRENRKLETERKKLLEEESEILSEIQKEEPSGSELEALEEVKNALKKIETERRRLLESSPEAYFGLHLRELKKWKRDLQEGKIVETDYVKAQIEDIVAHLRGSKPVMIYGYLGSGKSELAMHIAKNYIGKEALVISGSKHTSLAEFYGHHVLAINKINLEELNDFTREVEQKFNRWVEENPKADETEKTALTIGFCKFT